MRPPFLGLYNIVDGKVRRNGICRRFIRCPPLFPECRQMQVDELCDAFFTLRIPGGQRVEHRRATQLSQCPPGFEPFSLVGGFTADSHPDSQPHVLEADAG